MTVDSHLSQEEFFIKLTNLFETRKSASHGSIYLTQKRLNYPSPSSVISPTDSGVAFDPLEVPTLPAAPVLIRATNGVGKPKDPKTGKIVRDKGRKVKLSTIAQADELEGFFVRYAEVCRAGMSGLKKREKKKAGKKKGKK